MFIQELEEKVASLSKKMLATEKRLGTAEERLEAKIKAEKEFKKVKQRCMGCCCPGLYLLGRPLVSSRSCMETCPTLVLTMMLTMMTMMTMMLTMMHRLPLKSIA